MSISQKLLQFLFIGVFSSVALSTYADEPEDEPAITSEEEEPDQEEVLKNVVRRLNGRVEELERELSQLRKKNALPGEKLPEEERLTDPSMGDDPTASASLPTTAEDEAQVDAILSILSDKPEAKEDAGDPGSLKKGLEEQRDKATELAEKTAPAKMEVGDAMAQYNQAQSFFNKKEYGKAEKAFKEFQTVHAKHKMARSAKFWHAQAILNQADPQTNTTLKSGDKKKAGEAVKAFADYFKTYPKDDNIPSVLIGMSKSLALQGEKKKACVPLKKLKAEFPKATKSIATADGLMKKYGCQ